MFIFYVVRETDWTCKVSGPSVLLFHLPGMLFDKCFGDRFNPQARYLIVNIILFSYINLTSGGHHCIKARPLSWGYPTYIYLYIYIYLRKLTHALASYDSRVWPNWLPHSIQCFMFFPHSNLVRYKLIYSTSTLG